MKGQQRVAKSNHFGDEHDAEIENTKDPQVKLEPTQITTSFHQKFLFAIFFMKYKNFLLIFQSIELI